MEDVYRKRKIKNEDSDYYGYGDNNADKIDVDINDIVYRRKKKENPKIKRKSTKRK